MRLVKYRGRYYAYADGKRRALYTADRAIAEQKFEDFKKNVQRKKETIGEIVEAYLEAKKDKASIRRMGESWKSAKDTFCLLRPDQLSRAVCRSYILKRQEHGISNGTIRKELGIIRQSIRWNDPSAAPQIELPNAPHPKERYLSKAEFNRLLDKCTSPHLKLFVQVAIGTGARKGAILDLTWKQVDFDKGLITLTKVAVTNKRRAVVKMNDQLKTTLEMAKKDSLSEYVVSYAGRMVKSVNKGFREACTRAELKGVSPHTLRHTAAVWMAEKGISISEIAQFLGHSNEATTFRIYARYSPEYLVKAADALRY